MGIPIDLEMDEELRASSTHGAAAVIHHHYRVPAASSPWPPPPAPPVLPPRHPQRRLTQHYQSLRQHYADQPAIHRQPSTTTPSTSPPQMQVQHQNQQQQQQQEQHIPSSLVLSPVPDASEPDQSQTTRQTQQQRLQRQQQRRSSPSASALFRYYQQQQQQQQQQPSSQSQQPQQPSHMHSIAVRPRGNDSAADVTSQSQVPVSPTTLTTAPAPRSASPPEPLRRRQSTGEANVKDEEKEDKNRTTEAERIEQERIRAYRQSAEYERRKMALEREQLWRRCQQRSSSSTVTNATEIQPLRRSSQRQQELSNRAPLTSDSVSSTTSYSKDNEATRTTPSAARATERAQGDSSSDSGVDMQSSEEEEEEEEENDDEKEEASQAVTIQSLVAGRHHHRSFYALGPHRAPQVRSAIPAWPSSQASVTASSSARTAAEASTALPTVHVSASSTSPSTASTRRTISFTTDNDSNPQEMPVSHSHADSNAFSPIFNSMTGAALLPPMVSESHPRVLLGEHVNNAAVAPSLSVQHPLPPTAAVATFSRDTTPPSSATTPQIILPASLSALAPGPATAPLLSHSAILVQFKETTELQGTMENHAALQEQIRQALGPTVSMTMCCLLPDNPQDPDLLSKLSQLPIVHHAWKSSLVDEGNNVERSSQPHP